MRRLSFTHDHAESLVLGQFAENRRGCRAGAVSAEEGVKKSDTVSIFGMSLT